MKQPNASKSLFRNVLLQCCYTASGTGAMFDPFASGGSRLGIAIAAARERGMLGGGFGDDDAAGAGSPERGGDSRTTDNHMLMRALHGGEYSTPLQSPGGVADDDMFANFV